jgi:hypothetical protein
MIKIYWPFVIMGVGMLIVGTSIYQLVHVLDNIEPPMELYKSDYLASRPLAEIAIHECQSKGHVADVIEHTKYLTKYKDPMRAWTVKCSRPVKRNSYDP